MNQNLRIIAGKTDQKTILDHYLDFSLKTHDFFDNLSVEEEKQQNKVNDLIKSTLKQNHLQDLDVKVVIPDEVCSLQIIKLPLVSEKEIVSAIELQAEEFVPYPIEKASFDYQILSIDKSENQIYLLIIVTLLELIDRVSDFVLDFGLYPESLEPESTAIYRLLINQIYKTDADLVMFININNQSTQSSILNLTQKQLVTTNSFNIGQNFFYKALQNNLNLSASVAVETFNTITPKDAAFKQIITPLFTEYAKEVQKTILATVNKIGTIPKVIYIHSAQSVNTFIQLFNQTNHLKQYQIRPLIIDNIDSSKIALNESLYSKFSEIVIPLAALT